MLLSETKILAKPYLGNFSLFYALLSKIIIYYIFSNIISGQQTDIGVLTDFTRPTSGVRILEFESEIGSQTYDVELWDCSGDLEQGKIE